MKVANFMRTSVISVPSDEPVRTVTRLIFNLGIKSVPVCDNDKLVGIVTEEDILTKLFPSVRDFMEDRGHAFDFEAMEKNLGELINKPVKKIMTAKPKVVHPDLPIMQAQSMMIVGKISHLPVVDDDKKLVGIISQGDIFRAIVGQEIPYDDNEEYHAWLSRHWDLVVPWKQRLSGEIAAFNKIFEKKYTYRILDIFCGTGEHAIALAREGYDVIGMNKYILMHNAAMKKHTQLPEYLQRRIDFVHGDYSELLKSKKEDYDAAIFMGNALAHNPHDYKKIIKTTSQSLTKKNAIMILQIANFDKILANGGLQDFNARPSKVNEDTQYTFIEFYDSPKVTGKKDILTLNMTILRHVGHRWAFAAMNSTPIAYITAESITSLLKEAGFKKIDIFGSKFLEPLFEQKFSVKDHDWLNVVATR